ncbi:putative DUF899-domain-containing protein [Seiridium cardinale]
MSSKSGTDEEALAARVALLVKEKEHNRITDAIRAERRALPMVLVMKSYTFQSPNGTITLKDLLVTKSQLIIYHFMFEPIAEEGCQGCAFMAANFPDLLHLADKDTALAVVSRAQIYKIAPYKERDPWRFPRVSTNGSDFNYDFQVTLDEKVAHVEYNFQPKEKLDVNIAGEQPGLSVFKLEDGQVYHIY